jgi:hypothetical protein
MRLQVVPNVPECLVAEEKAVGRTTRNRPPEEPRFLISREVQTRIRGRHDMNVDLLRELPSTLAKLYESWPTEVQYLLLIGLVGAAVRVVAIPFTQGVLVPVLKLIRRRNGGGDKP